MPENNSLKDHQYILRQLLNESPILSLATLSKKKQPEASLVPFLFYENRFWIFVSLLSGHTQHLLDASDVSVLIHHTDKKITNPFSVQRVSAICQVDLETTQREKILDLMAGKLGDTVSLLRQLGDFYLFSLIPIKGRLIAGFGQAFDVDFMDMSLQHIRDSNR